jgi:hypothetical protein
MTQRHFRTRYIVSKQHDDGAFLSVVAVVFLFVFESKLPEFLPTSLCRALA